MSSTDQDSGRGQGPGARAHAVSGCAFCGLPLVGDYEPAAGEPLFCCFGCRFAAGIAAAGGDEGQARWAMSRLGLAVFFAMNVMVFTMLLWSQPEGGAEKLASAWYDLARYACLLFTLPVVLLLGGPLLTDALDELFRGRASLSLLLLVGVAAALAYSIWSLFTGTGHVYFEVACTILVATTLGRWLEATGKLKTTEALRGLSRLLPETVRLLRNGDETIVPATQLAAGDTFRVLPGERIAADGQIARQMSAVDEQVVTGESLPVVRRPGDRVLSGTLVLDGPLEIVAAASPGEGMIAQMVTAVTQATASRTAYQRLVERISGWFLPLIALIAAAALATHWWRSDLTVGLLAALAVLTIACPCALGLATPMALWAAVGRAAQAGVLLREGDALSRLARARTICFDKTGTLTTGRAMVSRAWFEASGDAKGALTVARALAAASNHPLSHAVADFAAERLSGEKLPPAEEARVIPGCGVIGHVAGIADRAYLGNRLWLAESGQAIPEELGDGNDDGAGDAETLVAWDGIARGRFLATQTIRPEAAGAMAELKRLGLNCLMLTGDRSSRAQPLARDLDLDYRAELLPEGKLAVIAELKCRGPVVMVGDGINDAPALAAADDGIALGSGTDISRHSSTVCLLADDLSRLPWLIELSRAAVRTIRWNLLWAFAYNIVGIGLAAAGWLHPIIAAIAMAVSSLMVISNSLLLAQFSIEPQRRKLQAVEERPWTTAPSHAGAAP